MRGQGVLVVTIESLVDCTYICFYGAKNVRSLCKRPDSFFFLPIYPPTKNTARKEETVMSAQFCSAVIFFSCWGNKKLGYGVKWRNSLGQGKRVEWACEQSMRGRSKSRESQSRLSWHGNAFLRLIFRVKLTAFCNWQEIILSHTCQLFFVVKLTTVTNSELLTNLNPKSWVQSVGNAWEPICTHEQRKLWRNNLNKIFEENDLFVLYRPTVSLHRTVEIEGLRGSHVYVFFAYIPFSHSMRQSEL